MPGQACRRTRVLRNLVRLRPLPRRDRPGGFPSVSGPVKVYSSPENRSHADWRVIPRASPIRAQVAPSARALRTHPPQRDVGCRPLTRRCCRIVFLGGAAAVWGAYPKAEPVRVTPAGPAVVGCADRGLLLWLSPPSAGATTTPWELLLRHL